MTDREGSDDFDSRYWDTPKMRSVKPAQTSSKERIRRTPIQVMVDEFRLARDSLIGVLRDVMGKNELDKDDY
jgi:hypothetical protein